MCVCVCVCVYLKEKSVVHVFCVDGRESVLVLCGDVDLVPGQNVAGGPELLDLALEHLFQPLVLKFCALHSFTQICTEHTHTRTHTHSPNTESETNMQTELLTHTHTLIHTRTHKHSYTHRVRHKHTN